MRVERYVPTAALVALALCAPALLWSAAPGEFPTPDPYIHLAYAHNLASRGVLEFRVGMTGIGTTSVLWVIGLAIGDALHLSAHGWAIALGVASLVAATLCLCDLAKVLWGETIWPFAAAALFGTCGNVAWLSLSGMETLLFLALGLGALAAYRRGRAILTGALLGLLALARIEGVILAAIILGMEGLMRRRITRLHVAVVLAMTAGLAPWLAFLWWRTGSPMPASLAGKRLIEGIATAQLAARDPLIGLLVRVGPVSYAAQWAGYTASFLLGGMYLPGPRIALPAEPDYGAAWLALALLAAVFIPLIARGVLSFCKWEEREGSGPRSETRTLVMTLSAWWLLHNLAYAVMLPQTGAAGRYAAVNHVALAVILVAGLRAIKSRVYRAACIVAIVAVWLAGWGYWRDVYTANVAYAQTVRRPLITFIRTLAPDQVVAATDVGIGTLNQIPQPLVDLSGFIDAQAYADWRAGRVADRLQQRGVTVIVFPEKAGDESRPLVDVRAGLGLAGPGAPELALLAAFEVSHREWARGNLPLGNYMPRLAVYRMVSSPED